MMRGEAWVATRDVNEPNLQLRAGQALPERFQVDYIMKENVLPFFDEGTFKKIKVEEPESGSAKELSELAKCFEEMRDWQKAFGEMFSERFDRLERVLVEAAKSAQRKD